jgi:hypothetical protein
MSQSESGTQSCHIITGGAHLDHQGLPVLGERHEIGHGRPGAELIAAAEHGRLAQHVEPQRRLELPTHVRVAHRQRGCFGDSAIAFSTTSPSHTSSRTRVRPGASTSGTIYTGFPTLAAVVSDPVDRLAVVRYDRIDGEITQVAAWASRWNVPVICNQFGVFRFAATPRDRAAWIADTRTALERHRIGWTMWDYSGGFGVVTKSSGAAVPDPVTLRALGLQP